MEFYRHRQNFTAKQTFLFGLFTVALTAGVGWFGYYLHFRFLSLVIGLLIILFAALLWLLSSLLVTVDESNVKAGFRLGVIHFSVPTPEIVSVKGIQFAWTDAYLRSANLTFHRSEGVTRSGKMINVCGRDAVELELKNGSYLKIGTNEADRLVAAINQAMQTTT